MLWMTSNSSPAKAGRSRDLGPQRGHLASARRQELGPGRSQRGHFQRAVNSAFSLTRRWEGVCLLRNCISLPYSYKDVCLCACYELLVTWKLFFFARLIIAFLIFLDSERATWFSLTCFSNILESQSDIASSLENNVEQSKINFIVSLKGYCYYYFGQRFITDLCVFLLEVKYCPPPKESFVFANIGQSAWSTYV